jgi:hypothetical protein
MCTPHPRHDAIIHAHSHGALLSRGNQQPGRKPKPKRQDPTGKNSCHMVTGVTINKRVRAKRAY